MTMPDNSFIENLEILLGFVGAPKGSADRILAGRDPSHLPDTPSLALLMADPLSIQDLILGSRRPVTMAGASALLLQWEQDLRSAGGPGRPVVPIWVGGGQGLLLTRAEHAPDLACHLVTAFEERMPGAALGVAHIVTSPRGLVTGCGALEGTASIAPALRALGVDRSGGGGFGGLVSRLTARLRVARDAVRLPPPTPPGTPRCGECGRRAATLHAQGHAATCARCGHFHHEGSAIAKRHERMGRAKAIHDLIGGDPAFIAADGAGVGQHLQSLRTLGQYRALSSALGGAFHRDTIGEILHDTLGPDHGRQTLILLAGGDDILLACGAQGSMDVALALVDGIERRLDDALAASWPAGDRPSPKIGVGLGLVVGQHTSARTAFALARNLVRNAKTALDGERVRSAIDFEILRAGAATATSVGVLRKGRTRPFEQPGKGRPSVFRAGLRPLPTATARRLNDRAKHLANENGEAGRSLLYRLRQAFDDDPVVGLVTASYLLSRHKGLAEGLAVPTDRVGAALDGFEGDLFCDLHEREENHPVFATGVPDLLDLARIARKEH